MHLTNQFLIAMPQLGDPNFHQSVIYIYEHTEQGATGIIINRPLALTLGDIFQQMDLQQMEPESESSRKRHNHPVYIGGPVNQERGFVLHTHNRTGWENTQNVTDKLAITTSRDILVDMAAAKGPEQSLVALGYAGWSNGQLEQEIAENAWLNSPASMDIIFKTPIERRWQAAGALLGVDLNLISGEIGHA